MIGQTMINVKASGARTRLSTLLAGIFVLILVVVLGDIVGLIPMAALVAVMVMVSVGTMDWHSVNPRTLRVMPLSETIVMAVTVAATVITHNLAIGVILGVVAIPATSMDLGMPTGGTDAHQSTSRQSYDAITRGFGEGFNAPLIVVARPDTGGTLDQADLGAITAELQGVDNVASVSLMGADPDRTLAMFNLIPKHGPDDARTASVVEALRDSNDPLSTRTQVTFGVTGLTAVNLDITDRLGAALPEYLTIIVGLSLLLLLLVFRSVVIPIKATAGFLLSIAATFGVATAVFQWGWLIGLVGLDTGGPLLSFLPIMVTGILYGLAMDYQVFLVSSMREAHAQGMSTRRAIVDGYAHASRVVVAAAIIMVSVFAAFVFSDDPTIKQFGFALAVGVIIDAFLVRLTLVPAVMSLLGDRLWWLPRWLDRLLPTIDIEGESHVPQDQAQATEPAHVP